MKYSALPLILNTWPDVFAKLVKAETEEVVAVGAEVVVEEAAELAVEIVYQILSTVVRREKTHQFRVHIESRMNSTWSSRIRKHMLLLQSSWTRRLLIYQLKQYVCRT
jgi:hypothetical protein